MLLAQSSYAKTMLHYSTLEWYGHIEFFADISSGVHMIIIILRHFIDFHTSLVSLKPI